MERHGVNLASATQRSSTIVSFCQSPLSSAEILQIISVGASEPETPALLGELQRCLLTLPRDYFWHTLQPYSWLRVGALCGRLTSGSATEHPTHRHDCTARLQEGNAQRKSLQLHRSRPKHRGILPKTETGPLSVPGNGGGVFQKPRL